MSQEFTQPTRGKTTIASDVLLTIARLTTQNVKGVSRLAHGPNVGVNRLFKRAQIQEGVQIEIIEDLVYSLIYMSSSKMKSMLGMLAEIFKMMLHVPSLRWLGCKWAVSTSTSKILIILLKLRRLL
jgi:hypothetical protein